MQVEYVRLVAQWKASHRPGSSSFELLYFNPDLQKAMTSYVEADPTHRQPMDCIEPSDGFHPSQPLQMLLAEQVWAWLDTEHPHVLPTVNPNNAKIRERFGNQGGY